LLRQIKGITVNFDEFNMGDKKKEFSIIRKKSSFEMSEKVDPENIFMSYNLEQMSQGRPTFTCAICFEEMLDGPKEIPNSPTKQHSETCQH
jgi:hypothetical protein